MAQQDDRSVRVSLNALYLQVQANLDYLNAAKTSDNEEKRQQMLDALAAVKKQLEPLYCGPAMGVLIKFE